MMAHAGQNTSMTSPMDAPSWLTEEETERHRRALANLLSCFDPSDSSVTIDTWFHKSATIGSFLGYEVTEMLPTMATKLRGEARAWYETLSEADRPQWRHKIIERFQTRWPAPKYMHMIATRTYRYDENIVLYYADKAALLQALGIHGRVAVECMVVETGLLEVEIEVQRRKIEDMADLLAYFGQLEFNRTFRAAATLTDETDIAKGERLETSEQKSQWLLRDRKMYLDWHYAKIHLAERLSEERSQSGNDQRMPMNVPEPQNVLSYKIPSLINSRMNLTATMLSLGVEPHFRQAGRFFDVVLNGNAPMHAYLDHTCGCIALRRREAVLLGLPYDLITDDDRTWLRHYVQDDFLRFGPGCERPLGFAWYQINIDQVTITAPVYIVRTELLHVPLLIGEPFTRNTNTTIIECGGYVRVCKTNSLVSENPTATGRSLQVRIGLDGEQPKVKTGQTVQARETREEDEAETCGPVSLVMGLEPLKEEGKEEEEALEDEGEEEEEADRSLLVRIGPDGEQLKVKTAQTVQAREMGEEDEAKTCDSVSLVLDLDQWEKEEEEAAWQAWVYEEAGWEDWEEGEAGCKVEEQEEVWKEEETGEAWVEECEAEEDDEEWEEAQEDDKTWKQEMEWLEQERVWEEETRRWRKEWEDAWRYEEVEEKEEEDEADPDGELPKVKPAQTVQTREIGEQDETKICGPVSLVLDLEQRKEEGKEEEEALEDEGKEEEEADRSLLVRIGPDGEQLKVKTAQTVQTREMGEEDEAETFGPVSLGLDLEQREEEGKEKEEEEAGEVEEDEKKEENKEKKERDNENDWVVMVHDVDEKEKGEETPETLKFSQIVETIDEQKQKGENSPPSEAAEENWVVVAETDRYHPICTVS